MKKIILIAVAVIVVIAAGVAYFLYSSLDSIVKEAIETVGTQTAGVSVKVDSVKLSLTDGTGTISGLSVGNPAGFKSPTAFKVASVTIALDIGSITKNPIVINEIAVASPEVTYELNSSGGSNFQAIEDHVKQASGGGQAASSSGTSNGPKMVIKKLDITNGTVNLATPIPGGKTGGSLGDIHLTNIGQSSGGATASQVAEQVLNSIANGAMNAASKLGVGQALDKLKGTATGLVPGSSGSGGVGGTASGALKSLFGK
ncbi:MAG TPA: hypothetical protein VMF53_04315 [Alphaproteobacteria bacterium]|nr:hypothetical protein [Alphaproteobacteria bacterium]